MTKTLVTIESELLEATDFKKARGMSRQKFLAGLVGAASDLAVAEWNELSDEAQKWVNEQIMRINKDEEVEEPGNAEGDSKPARKKRGGRKAAKKSEPEEEEEEEEEDGEEEEEEEEKPKRRSKKTSSKKTSTRRKPEPEEEEDEGDDEEEEEEEEEKPAPKRSRKAATKKTSKKTSRRKKPEPEDDDEEEEEEEKPKRRRKRGDKKKREPAVTAKYRKLCCQNLGKGRDTVIELAEKKGLELKPNTASLIYYNVQKTVRILRELELMD